MSIPGAEKPKKGRPSVDSEAVNVRLERSGLVDLDHWRRSQADLPSRPEAIRRLMEVGLKAATSDKPPITPASAEEVL